MPRLNVPLSIREARTDRLRVSVKLDDGKERIIPGARAPTVGQAAGQGTTRSPSNFLLGARTQQDQETTIQVVLRALVGTEVFNFLDKTARDKAPIDLDFRVFGTIDRIVISEATGAAGILEVADFAGIAGLSELKLKGNKFGLPAGDSGSSALTIGDDANSDLKRGTQLSIVKAGTIAGSKLESFIEADGTIGTNEDAKLPAFLVVSDVLYDAAGENPKAFVVARTAITNWPNDGDISSAADNTIAIGDQCVKWTASGEATGFQPGFGEDSALYTLDVTLTDAMPTPRIIHPAEVNIGNPAYA